MVGLYSIRCPSVLITFAASLTMYQHAQNLHELVMSSPSVVIDLGPEELEAYLLAMNCLSLIDSKDAWILMPADIGLSVCCCFLYLNCT
jgi:hypothetical protein